LDTVQAAVLLAKLPHLDKWIEKRQEAAQRYMDLLSSNENIALPEVAGHAARHVWNQFVVRINDNGKRNEAQKKLKEKGIGTGVYYPLPLHLQECFSYLGYREGDFPNSEKAARETLALPMFPGLEREEQEEVSRRLGEVL
jgi:dTDP-4-amino-4,6-dideoxygalactose transaminase